MRRVASLAIALACGTASAQTPGASFVIPDFVIDPSVGNEEVFTVSTAAIDFSSPFVAWRFTAEWSGLGGIEGAFSSDYIAGMGVPSSTEFLSGPLQAYNGRMDTDEVNRIGFAAEFPGPIPAGFEGFPGDLAEFVVTDTLGFGEGTFANGLLEWFREDDLAANTTSTGPKSANTPPLFVDLGTLTLIGETIVFDTFGSEIFDTEIALYASNGTVIVKNDDAGEIGTPDARQSRVIFPGTSIEIRSDGTVVRRLLGRGEYYLAVAAFNATFEEDFDVIGTAPETGGYVLNAALPGAARAPIGAGTLAPGKVIWYRFTVIRDPNAMGCNAADVEPDDRLDLQDVQTFLIGFAAMDPVADIFPDGEFNLSDVQTFLIDFGAGCP